MITKKYDVSDLKKDLNLVAKLGRIKTHRERKSIAYVKKALKEDLQQIDRRLAYFENPKRNNAKTYAKIIRKLDFRRMVLEASIEQMESN